jgi:DNA-binding NtrC family response regulator
MVDSKAEPALASRNRAPPSRLQAYGLSPDRNILPTADAIVFDPIVQKPDGHFRSLDEIRAHVIRTAFQLYGGNASEVARHLGLSRSSLYRLVRDCGLVMDDFRRQALRSYPFISPVNCD